MQILQAINVGVAKRDLEDDAAEENALVGGEAVGEEEKKFETKYLDPSLIKEKKKQNKDRQRMMKLTLTDGLNNMEAMEFERLRSIDHFNIGQKLLLTPPIEVRRGILFLTNSNVSYIGSPIVNPTSVPP